MPQFGGSVNIGNSGNPYQPSANTGYQAPYNPYNPNQSSGSNAPAAPAYSPPSAPTGTAGSWLGQLAGAQNSSDIANPIMKQANGTWTVPETFMAGNRWSKGNINKDWATGFGGTYAANNQPKMTYVQNTPGVSGGSWVPMSGRDAGTAPGTWSFNQDPTQFISNGTGASFQGGQGSNNSWKSAFKEVAPIAGIAAAPFLAAGLAGMAGGGSFMGGIGGMSGMGGAAAGAGGLTGASMLPAGAMQGMGGGLAAGASGVGGALAPAAGGMGAAGAAGAGAGALGGGAALGGGGFNGMMAAGAPSMAGSATMGGSGIGAAGGTGFGAAGLTAPTAAQMAGGAAGGGGGLSGLFGQAKDYASSLFGGGGGGAGGSGGLNLGKGLLGLGQGIMQYQQGKQLKDIAAQAADRADPLHAPERRPYQDLLSQYYFGGQDITQQPMMKANLDFARNESDAKLARMGFSGSGAQATAAGDYTNKVFQANAMPYLNTLQGIAGFGMGPGNAGSLYQGGMTQASGAPMQALGSVVNGFTSPQPPQNPWFADANYSQNQMTQVPGAGTYQRMA